MDGGSGSHVSQVEDLTGFMQWFFAAQILGLLSVLGVFYWCLAFAGGFGLTGGGLFNWHPLFMTIGMVYLLGNGVITFRSYRNMHKNTLKLTHSSINVIALVFIVLGALAVLINHIESNGANFYTLHSWVGLIAVLLYLVQAVIGFIAFLYPGVQAPTRAWLLPYHVYIGHAVFVIGVAAAVIGVEEKILFSMMSTYASLGSQALLLNILGVLFVAYAAAITFISTNSFYKRYPRPEDSELLPKLS